MAFTCQASLLLGVAIGSVALPQQQQQQQQHHHHPSPGAGKRDYVFAVNPNGANGRTGREWKNLLPMLNAKLGEQYNVREVFTSGPSHAIEIAREAIKDGAAAVVAVGGDGILNEVINGFFEDGKPVQSKEAIGASKTALGLIPLGTGSDFARNYGWKNNPYDAIERLAKEQRKPIDVGCLTTGECNGHHFFLNVASLHLSAKAGYYATKYKMFGNLCYVIGAFQAFTDHTNQDMQICVDGREWYHVSQVTAMAIGNAKYFGGGMKITPTADPCSGDLEVVTLQGFKWHDFLLKMHKLYKGTHLSVKNVSSQRVHSIEIVEANGTGRSSKNKVFVQADGEHVGFLPATISIIPGSIDLLT